MTIFIFVLTLGSIAGILAGGGVFDYHDPNHNWPKTCHGNNQSPININTSSLIWRTHYPKLFMCRHHLDPEYMNITNNGHSVQLEIEYPRIINSIYSQESGNPNHVERPKMFGGPLGNDAFTLSSIHYHWGETDDDGSEHSVDGQNQAVEMHMVYYNEFYGNLKDASDKSDGLAVISHLYGVSSYRNKGIQKFEKNFDRIVEIGKTTDIRPFKISEFDISLARGYYTYSGSLTTPPCTENVRWIVSRVLKKISAKQLAAFRKMKLNHDDHHNNRYVQETHRRHVELIDADLVSERC